MRIVLATIGTLGDLHPFMGLALALQREGADVVLAAAAEYQPKIEAAGLSFVALRPSFADIEQDLALSRAEITRRMIAHRDFLFRKLVNPYLAAGFDDMLRATEGADLVLTGTLAIGARLAAEKRGLPWIGIALQPLMFLSAHDAPVVPGADWATLLLRTLRPSARAHALRLFKAALTPLLRPVRRLRAQAGLAPSRANPLFEGQFSASGAIALYSSVLGERRPDYPQPTLLAGFAWFDSEDGRAQELGVELRDFLAAGDAPLVFTLGSVVVHSPGDFYRNSAAAAAQLGRRAVLLVGEERFEDCAPLGSAQVLVARYAPHSLLFARAAATIHHGGIGTLAQALRAGKPQLVVPFFADQFDNAQRARARCGARVLAPKQYSIAAAARVLHDLLHDQATTEQARAIGAEVAAEDGAARAARAILGGWPLKI